MLRGLYLDNLLIFLFGLDMAASMDFPAACPQLEGGCNKDNVSVMEDETSENQNNMKHMKNRKPPRHLPVMRHSVGSLRVLETADLVSSC